MPYIVKSVKGVTSHGARVGEYTDMEHFENGLNLLEEEGYTLKSVLHSGTGDAAETRLIFHQKKAQGIRRRSDQF